ncbi:unnamed protein product [Durusdinium trenchii]|uniref:Glycosyltransferase family 92 protein n=1 Tax=Durusdinium trenchii TaxID=1381693 RepID=A0ABP0MWX8_9DINO
MCPANEIQRGALPPLVSGANRSEVFCDSVGCQVPYRIGLRSFSLLRMGWGYTSRAWLGLSRASVQRRGRRWRCAERQEVVLDPDLFSPETLTQAAEPLQRYTYESLFGGSAASESSAFSVDHQVFGNYGSLWSFFALADPSRWTMADGMTPACPSTCTLAIRAVRLLAEVDQWRNSSPARRLQQLSQLSLLFGKGDQWESLRTWVWPRLTELWKEDASWILQELTEPQRSCFDALNTGKAAEVLEAFGNGSFRPLECQGPKTWPHALIAASMRRSDEGREASSSRSLEIGRKWRLCGMPGEVMKQGFGRGFQASLLGAWAEDHGSAWEVELSLFVAPRDLCVLVDGNRLFQTHPQSYLTPWSCFMQHERRSSRSSGQGVVSYSGTVALLRCRFPTAPQGAVELTVSSTIIPLQALGWSLTGIRLCPLQPLSPGLLATGPSSSSSSSRKLVVCSEVLYSLRGAYKSTLVKHWLEYHRLIGVDHFVIYDRDGSLEEDGVLEPYIKTGYVSYFPRFSFFALSEHHDAVHALPGLPSAAAPDAQAASHCLFMQRGLTEWVSFLHSPDEYLSNKHGLRHVEEVLGVLRPLRDQGLAAVDVTAIYFTRSMHRKPQGPVRPSPWLFGRYVYRASVPIQLRDWGSPVAGFLNRFGSPLVVPERVSDLVSAHYPRPAAGTFYLDDVPMDFLRANHYGEAFHPRQIIEEDDTPVKDESILWAEEAMANLNLEPLPPGPEPAEPTSG